MESECGGFVAKSKANRVHEHVVWELPLVEILQGQVLEGGGGRWPKEVVE